MKNSSAGKGEQICVNRTRKEAEEQESRGKGIAHRQMPTLLRWLSGIDQKLFVLYLQWIVSFISGQRKWFDQPNMVLVQNGKSYPWRSVFFFFNREKKYHTFKNPFSLCRISCLDRSICQTWPEFIKCFSLPIAEYFWRVYGWRAETMAQFNFSSDLHKIWMQPSPATAKVQVPIPPAGPGNHFKLSAAKEARELCSTSAQICTLSMALNSPRAAPGGTAPTRGQVGSNVWAEAKLQILRLNTVPADSSIHLSGCLQQEQHKNKKEGSKHVLDLTERWGRNLEVKNCLKSCGEKGCLLLFASTWAEGGRVVVNSN